MNSVPNANVVCLVSQVGPNFRIQPGIHVGKPRWERHAKVDIEKVCKKLLRLVDVSIVCNIGQVPCLWKLTSQQLCQMDIDVVKQQLKF